MKDGILHLHMSVDIRVIYHSDDTWKQAQHIGANDSTSQYVVYGVP